ncbi:DoxX family protein [Novosphingobium terrae]|uniref:DoxX family protein n=1 Tax=Novosphingobium terrae TaxID=2726189 RepID=UPI00197E137D|nr:DoxX family protein [Novosphingobium terrae]
MPAVSKSSALLRRLWDGEPSTVTAAPYAALLLRITLAAFFLAHLYNKFFTKDGFWGWWAALTRLHSAYVPIYVLSVEFFCAILLPLGFKTRWVALYAVPSFIGIIAFWIRIGGYWFTNPGAEFPVMWLCLLILQVVLGDGAFSLKTGRG